MSDNKGQTQNACGCDYSQMPLPEVDFRTFVFSLYSSAMVHLGETPDPDTGQSVFQRHLAKHTIDILALLEAKTKGNLDANEQKTLCEMLCQLRLKFVAKTSK